MTPSTWEAETGSIGSRYTFMAVARKSLIEKTDRRLYALVCGEGAEIDREIERLMVEARPVIDTILSRYRRSGTLLVPEDVDDVVSTVNLRLLKKLRAIPESTDEPIQNFQSYVAALTYNSVSDFMRRHFPDHARLKRRVRYALTHDQRLAMWNTESGPTAGLAGWSGTGDALREIPFGAISTDLPPGDSAETIFEILSGIQRPILVDAIVSFLGRFHGREPAPTTILEKIAASGDDPATRVEDRDFLRALWDEVRQLRPAQRKALLLNLRYDGDLDVVTVLVMSGIATFDALAATLEMQFQEMIAVWKHLPLGDAEIAEMLHVTRQQVINLRKAARDRLSRRLPR